MFIVDKQGEQHEQKPKAQGGLRYVQGTQKVLVGQKPKVLWSEVCTGK